MIRKENNKSRVFVLGSLLILIGILIPIIRHLYYGYLDSKNEEKIENFFEKDKNPIKTDLDISKEQYQNQKIETINYKYEKYIAVLEIPTINLKRGVFDKQSVNNNVNKNIYVLSETTLPDEKEYHHIILASHSGYGYTAFFRNLNQLNYGDLIFFYYKGINYIYKISNIYEIEKTGSMNLNLSNNSDMTLVTCVYGTNRQLVIVANLIDEEKY